MPEPKTTLFPDYDTAEAALASALDALFAYADGLAAEGPDYVPTVDDQAEITRLYGVATEAQEDFILAARQNADISDKLKAKLHEGMAAAFKVQAHVKRLLAVSGDDVSTLLDELGDLVGNARSVISARTVEAVDAKNESARSEAAARADRDEVARTLHEIQLASGKRPPGSRVYPTYADAFGEAVVGNIPEGTPVRVEADETHLDGDDAPRTSVYRATANTLVFRLFAFGDIVTGLGSGTGESEAPVILNLVPSDDTPSVGDTLSWTAFITNEPASVTASVNLSPRTVTNLGGGYYKVSVAVDEAGSYTIVLAATKGGESDTAQSTVLAIEDTIGAGGGTVVPDGTTITGSGVEGDPLAVGEVPQSKVQNLPTELSSLQAQISAFSTSDRAPALAALRSLLAPGFAVENLFDTGTPVSVAATDNADGTVTLQPGGRRGVNVAGFTGPELSLLVAALSGKAYSDGGTPYLAFTASLGSGLAADDLGGGVLLLYTDKAAGGNAEVVVSLSPDAPEAVTISKPAIVAGKPSLPVYRPSLAFLDPNAPGAHPAGVPAFLEGTPGSLVVQDPRDGQFYSVAMTPIVGGGGSGNTTMAGQDTTMAGQETSMGGQ